MKRFSHSFCIILFLLSCYQIAEAKPAQVKALRLNQTHFFFGDTQLTVAPNALLMENKGNLSFTLVSKAPDWKVIVYRTDEKVCMAQDLKQFEVTGLVSDYLVRLHNRKLVTEYRTTFEFCGKKAVRLTGGSGSTSPHLEYLPIRGICAPEVERILYSAYKFPTCGGIPLRFSKAAKGGFMQVVEHKKGDRKTLLETKSLKTVEVDESVFDAPLTGYHKSTSIIEVVSGNKGKSKDKGLMELLEAEH